MIVEGEGGSDAIFILLSSHLGGTDAVWLQEKTGVLHVVLFELLA